MICSMLLTFAIARPPERIGLWESEYRKRRGNCVELVIERGRYRHQDAVVWEKSANAEECE